MTIKTVADLYPIGAMLNEINLRVFSLGGFVFVNAV